MTVAVVAHRGASFVARENTLEAFERAIALGADFVELDVQASADGILVVFHDLTLDRLTPLSGPLGRRTAAELAEVGIPTLQSSLEVARGRAGVMAELKSPWRYRRHDVVRRTADLLAPEDALLSFEPRALVAAVRHRPALRVLQHVGFGVSIARASRYAWGVGIARARATSRAVAAAHRAGLWAGVYTVNEPEEMRRLAALGVDGIFSDRPDVLREALRA